MKSSKKRIQQSVAYVIIALLLMFAVHLYRLRSILCFNLVIGVFIGMIMSRTKFSFSGNLRGPILFRDFTYTKLFWNLALITCLGMNTVVLVGSKFGIFNYQAYLNEPTRVSMYFFISAFIFGSGIAFTGVAGSGLVRNAFNLKLDYIVALVMYFIGSVCGVLIREYFISRFSEMSLYMPELFGWPVAIITQIALMYGYYRVIKNAERIYIK